jgi:molybdopterin-synthase adenylyltransferase
MRARLLASEDETVAFILASPVKLQSGDWRLLALEMVYFAEDQYTYRSRDGVEVSPAAVAGVLKRGRSRNLSVVLAHTHPWHGSVAPSEVDREGESKLLPTIRSRIPNVPHARLILGHSDSHAALLCSTNAEKPLEVYGVGSSIYRPPVISPDGSESEFDRQVLAFGEMGQRTIARTRVAIVGLGGVGSAVAQQLAYLGVRDWLLVDPDVVESTNLNRIVGATRLDIGIPKVEVAKRAILAINDRSQVEALRADVTRSEVARRLLDADFFFGCTDSHGSRAVLNQLCYQFLLPGVDLGVRIDVSGEGSVRQITGRAQMLGPGLACLACSQVLDPEAVRRDLMSPEERRADRYIVGVGERQPQPAVVSLNTTVAGLGVSMFMAALTGLPMLARHQVVRFEVGDVRVVQTRADPECNFCSSSGFLARGDTWPLPGRPATIAGSEAAPDTQL